MLSNDPVVSDLLAMDSLDRAIAVAWPPVTGADFVLAASVTGPSFGDSGLLPASAYRYKVAAVIDGTEAAASETVQAITRATPAI